jgi:formiminoglutamase
MIGFTYYKDTDMDKFTVKREGEIKLGQNLKTNLYKNTKYAILGLPESIGVKQNHGIAGTESLWNDFLRSFCNIQSTNSLDGNNITIVGHLEVDDRTIVAEIDEFVTQIIKEVLSSGIIPIIIGGGHNNAYGNIKGSYLHFNKPVNVINLDPHADFRRLEHRHSGNGFSYAMHEGYLQKYAMVGLHKNYNAQSMVDSLTNNVNIHFSYYEDIFIEEKLSFVEAIRESISFTNEGPVGIEIDLDCIEYSLTSAMTPCGLSSRDVRKFIYTMVKDVEQVCYFHIAEGAIKLEDGRIQPLTGKLVSYLVSDFVRYSDLKSLN